MIDRARESRNPKKVIRVTLMESYGEIGRVPVNLYKIIIFSLWLFRQMLFKKLPTGEKQQKARYCGKNPNIALFSVLPIASLFQQADNFPQAGCILLCKPIFQGTVQIQHAADPARRAVNR